MGVLVRAACEACEAEDAVNAGIEAVDALSDGGSDDSIAGPPEQSSNAATLVKEDHASMAEYVLGPCNDPMGGVQDIQEEAATIS